MSKATQAMYDALKQVREVGETWVTWNGERLRLGPVTDVYWGSVFEAVIKARRRGGISVATVDAYKDSGTRVRLDDGRFYRAGWDAVLAVILERHPRGTTP